jgi:hypothetical protein
VPLERRDRLARALAVRVVEGQAGSALLVEEPLERADRQAAVAHCQLWRQAAPRGFVDDPRDRQALRALVGRDGRLRARAEQAVHRHDATLCAEQVLERPDIRPAVAEALDREDAAERADRGRREQDQQHAREERHEESAGAANRWVHPAG